MPAEPVPPTVGAEERGVLALEAVEGGAPGGVDAGGGVWKGGGAGGAGGGAGAEVIEATTYHESEIRGFAGWGEGSGRGRTRAASAAI